MTQTHITSFAKKKKNTQKILTITKDKKAKM